MSRKPGMTLVVTNDVLKLSGDVILVISLSHIVELMKGELYPRRRASLLVYLAVLAAAVGGAGYGMSVYKPESEYIRWLYWGAGGLGVLYLTLLIVGMIRFFLRDGEYGLTLCTALGESYTIIATSDDKITSIMQDIILGMHRRLQAGPHGSTYTGLQVNLSARAAETFLRQGRAAGLDVSLTTPAQPPT